MPRRSSRLASARPPLPPLLPPPVVAAVPDPARPSAKKSKKKMETDVAGEAATAAPFGDMKSNAPIPMGSKEEFVGDPVSAEKAQSRWPHRYGQNTVQVKEAKTETKKRKRDDEEEVEVKQAHLHYSEAIVDDVHYNLNDDAYVLPEEGDVPHICRIIELFEATDGTPYVTCQWFYRPRDTDIQGHDKLIDGKRIFLSEVTDTNHLSCLKSKLKIVEVNLGAKETTIPCDYYYDMKYLLPYSSFIKVNQEVSTVAKKEMPASNTSPLLLLDLYAGCGAMSTGLCLGSELSGSKMITRWAVDLNKYACQSLQFNHPKTKVINGDVGNFLQLLKEWGRLCATFSLTSDKGFKKYTDFESEDEDEVQNGKDSPDSRNSEDFEVQNILDICYRDKMNKEEAGLYLKVRWKNYGPKDDTWEPISALSNCGKAIREFVVSGYNSKFLPLPGSVDVICGGPPCQGISGLNRHRNTAKPFEDDKNKQIKVFMDVIDYLKPRFTLMENVVDILKFEDGYIGSYALGRLIEMKYQARIGIMASGCYGLPQFRMRAFFWGAAHTEMLPQFPFPTHDVVLRGGAPVKFQKNVVAYDEGHSMKLKKELFLGDAISDLPPVTNFDAHEEMKYLKRPETDFQRHIRSKRDELGGLHNVLYDHIPYKLNEDDYLRSCEIPKKKGACFRDLRGVLVNKETNTVYFDPEMERVELSTGSYLVPNYTMTYVKGKSTKPFGRLWWDETVSTVVTRAEPHNQRILHPVQDRVLTIRENARLQGFPDYYKLFGPVKERYTQVGNAVAVPVARALGYALGIASQGLATAEPAFTLPDSFQALI